MALSDKTINGKTPDDFVMDVYEVVKWIKGFVAHGEETFGKECLAVLAIMGLPMMSLVDAVEKLGKMGDKMVDKLRDEANRLSNERKLPDNLIKGLGIKLEGDGDVKPS